MKEKKIYLTKKQMAGGLPLLTRKMPESKVACLALWVEIGSIYEQPELAGISHFMEHIFFKGTSRRGVGKIAQEVHGLGGYLNGFTSWEHTCFWMIVPTRYMEKGLDILSDALLNPLFDKEELEKERKVILEEIRMGKDLPEHYALEKLLETSFQRHLYRIPIIGYDKTIRDMPRQDLIDFHRDYYTAPNLFLSIAGGIDEEKTIRLVEKIFRDLPGKSAPIPVPPKEKSQTGFREKTYHGDILTGFVMLGYHIPEILSRDFYSCEILSAVLGQGQTSRLPLKLREESRLVLKVLAGSITSKDPGLLLVEAILLPEKLEAAKSAIFQEIERLQQEEITPLELEKAKNQLASQYLFQLETCEGMAQNLGFYHSMGDYREAERYLAGLEKVGIKQVKQAAQKYLKMENCSLVSYLPSPKKGNKK